MDEKPVYDGMVVEYSTDGKPDATPAPAPAAPVVETPTPAAPIQVEAPATAQVAPPTETESTPGGSVAEPQSQPVETFKYAGREVTAKELYEITTQNLLPAYTKATQELSRYKQGGTTINGTETPPVAPNAAQKPWEDPNWVPESYGDVVKLATENAKEELRRDAELQAQFAEEAKTITDTALAEIRKTDPGLNEDALFSHINKFGFTDVKLGYENFKMVQEAKREAAAAAAKITRQEDPIAGKTGAILAADDGYDPSNIGQYESATDALRAIKK